MSFLPSPINALSYQILCSEYKVLDLKSADTVSRNINFSFNVESWTPLDEEQYQLETMLTVSAVPGKDEECGCAIKVTVRGMFEGRYLSDGGTMEDFEMFMKVNAFSLLYGFVRSHVQTITSMTPSGQICLPCVDVSSIAEEFAAIEAESSSSTEEQTKTSEN